MHGGGNLNDERPRGSKMHSRSAAERGSRIFISYSSADQKWLDRLLRHLRPLTREGSIQLFSNRNIRIGGDWRKEIQAALGDATIAILLVSADFLASDFIMSQELPPLIAAAAKRGTIIMPVIVGPSLYEKIPSLSQFQAANSPDRPLSAMSASEWNSVLVNLAREIHEVTKGVE
jgi:hypothetical protein